jgi:hypothetical protein
MASGILRGRGVVGTVYQAAAVSLAPAHLTGNANKDY